MELIGVSKPVWRALMVGLGLAGLTLGLWFVNLRKGKSEMDVMEVGLAEGVGIPPIDASAPTETATATFALG
jgi:hypothetical protein